MTDLDPRAAALEDLRSWALHQATARQRLTATAWRAGVRNVAELARAAGVSRDTVYEDLRRENIDPKDRSAMPAVVLTRRAQIRARLDQILTISPDTGWVIGSPAGPRRAGGPAAPPVDHDAARRQLDRIRLLQLLYGADEVAGAYMAWLDAFLAGQAETAPRLTSWSDVPSADMSPIPTWGRDLHGFLCVCCGENFWQVQLRAGHHSSGDRLCRSCARSVVSADVDQLWYPVLPGVHGHAAFPGLLPGEPQHNTLAVTWANGGSPMQYVAGDADPYFPAHGWMGMSVDHRTVTGDVAAPTLTARGRTTARGHEFEWSAEFTYDPAVEAFRSSPYGFRLTSGTLIGLDGVSTYRDPYDMLERVLAGAGDNASPQAVARRRLRELLVASVTTEELQGPGQRGRGAIQIAHELGAQVPELAADEVLRLVQQYIVEHGRPAGSTVEPPR